MISSTEKADDQVVKSGVGSRRPGSAPVGVSQRVVSWFREEALLVSVLLGVFLMRLLLADRNSYWLDEIYSVTIHGGWNESAIDLVRVLASGGVYPPVYFVILFEWMSWFGDLEATTRLLSNAFVTLAGLFLYLSMRIVFRRRIAIASVVVFSLMYTTMFYGLETRPYALTILLVTLSSYLLLLLKKAAGDRGWRLALVSPLGSLFVVVNVALLLTHLYNVFFWAAQGLLVIAYVLREVRAHRWLAGISVATALYGLQAAVFMGVWGRPLLNGFEQFGGDFAIDGAEALRNPLTMTVNVIVRPNLDTSPLFLGVGAVLVAVLTSGALVTLARRHGRSVKRTRSWMTVYLVGWLFLPQVLAYLGFLIAGVARYSNRFFVFSVVPLAPLAVLSVEEIARLTGIAFGKETRLDPRDHGGGNNRSRLAILLAGLLIGLMVLPGTFEAVAGPKADWRGISRDVVDIVDSDPDASYAIYETSFRRTPVLDYYLGRYSDDIRVMGTITRAEERRGEFSFEQSLAAIEEHDFLVVPFIHHSVDDFPLALTKLRDLYEVHHWQIGPRGKGIVIFSLSDQDRRPRVTLTHKGPP